MHAEVICAGNHSPSSNPGDRVQWRLHRGPAAGLLPSGGFRLVKALCVMEWLDFLHDEKTLPLHPALSEGGANTPQKSIRGRWSASSKMGPQLPQRPLPAS